MNDRELLELAAKATGITVKYTEPSLISGIVHQIFLSNDGYQMNWFPLDDDGDAVRLAIQLKIYINFDGMEIGYRIDNIMHIHPINILNGDLAASIRRSIVIAAAEIGEGMK